MRTIDFTINEYFPVEDKVLYEKMHNQFISDKEKEFFQEMICKELYDCPVSTFDVFVHENDNDEKLFIQKMFNNEYEIGRFSDDGSYVKMDSVPQSLSELLVVDLYPLVNQHITVLEWLRGRDYRVVRYDYPWEE